MSTPVPAIPRFQCTLPGWAQTVILGFVFLLVLGLIIVRYYQLDIHIRVTRFFDNSHSILPLGGIPELPTTLDAHLPRIQAQPGDLLPYLKPHLQDTAERYLKDPFSPNPKQDYLPLRYGRVRHSVPIKIEWYDKSEPVFFTWSAGPGGITPILEEASGKNGIREYRFLSPAYSSTNGLKSAGYLFADNRGVQLGKIRY